MTKQFALRPMLPGDGLALKSLMESDPEPETPMALVTRFLVDPYRAWLTLKPTMIGVVAEAPGAEGLVGTATVAFDEAQFDGQILPSAFLENLKVHHAYRGQGIGTKLAQWRVNAARERFGDDGVIMTGTNSQNTASLATMKKWCSQFAGPMVITPRPTRSDPPDAPAGITVRPAQARDFPEIANLSNRFYADYNLYSPLSPETLTSALNESPAVYHYRVALDDQGNLVAGTMLSERSQLMVDEFRNVPPPVRANPQFPKDGFLRLLEVSRLWFDGLDYAQYLWEYVRWEFRDRVNTLSMQIDPRSPLNAVIVDQPGAMKMELVFALHASTVMSGDRLISGVFRG